MTAPIEATTYSKGQHQPCLSVLAGLCDLGLVQLNSPFRFFTRLISTVSLPKCLPDPPISVSLPPKLRDDILPSPSSTTPGTLHTLSQPPPSSSSDSRSRWFHLHRASITRRPTPPRHGSADTSQHPQTNTSIHQHHRCFIPAHDSVFPSHGGLMQDVKGTAMPVPAADATTDAVRRNDVPVCASGADGARETDLESDLQASWPHDSNSTLRAQCQRCKTKTDKGTDICLSLSLTRIHARARADAYLQFFYKHFFVRATRCPTRNRLKAGPVTG